MNNRNLRKFKEFGYGAIGFVSLALAASVLAIPINWLQGLIIPWMVEYLPWLFLIAGLLFSLTGSFVYIATISLVAVLPVSLILLVFKGTKWLGARGLQYTAYILLSNIWIWSIGATVNLAGILWLAIGLSFAGIGVIPIAFIVALLRTEWSTAFGILLGTVIGILLANFSGSLAAKDDARYQKIRAEIIRKKTRV